MEDFPLPSFISGEYHPTYSTAQIESNRQVLNLIPVGCRSKTCCVTRTNMDQCGKKPTGEPSPMARWWLFHVVSPPGEDFPNEGMTHQPTSRIGLASCVASPPAQVFRFQIKTANTMPDSMPENICQIRCQIERQNICHTGMPESEYSQTGMPRKMSEDVSDRMSEYT